MNCLSRIAAAMCAVALLSGSVVADPGGETPLPCDETCMDMYTWTVQILTEDYETRIAACGTDLWCKLAAELDYQESLQLARELRDACCESVD